jgi:hypothetical protein
MHIKSSDYRVGAGKRVELKKWPTLVDPVYKTSEEYQDLLRKHIKALSAQQELLYASNRYAVLLIFQAMDAAGKDGAIAHVMSGVNPQGCQVFSFKHPSTAELQHDFLWRTTRDLPERGRLGIFNRSYYEEVLIARVHPEILRAEGLPEKSSDDEAIWHDRKVLEGLHARLRKMSQCDQYRARTLVCRPGRRQAQHPPDRLQNPPRYRGGARVELSEDHAGAPARIAVAAQEAVE